MPTNSQLELFVLKRRDPFGGMLQRGKRKEKRPLPLKAPLHIVLKSEVAKGKLSMKRRGRHIEKIIRKHAALNGVHLLDLSNDGSHLHLLARFASPSRYKVFIRSITGLIARVVLGVERGRSKGLSFWAFRPFSRIVKWSNTSKARKASSESRLDLFALSKYCFNIGDALQNEIYQMLKSLDPPMLKVRGIC